MARTTNYLQSWKDKIKQIGTSVQQKVQEVTGVDSAQTNNIKNILLPLNILKAAPSFVTYVILKKLFITFILSLKKRLFTTTYLII